MRDDAMCSGAFHEPDGVHLKMKGYVHMWEKAQQRCRLYGRLGRRRVGHDRDRDAAHGRSEKSRAHPVAAAASAAPG